MKLRSVIQNGNYKIHLFDDGTKLRVLDDNEEEFNAVVPECIDICISKKCNIGCPYCHEGATKNGDIFSFDQLSGTNFGEFLSSLAPLTELAIGGGAISEIPIRDLKNLFSIFIENYCIINLTINIKETLNTNFKEFLFEFFKNPNFGGIGISYNRKYQKELLSFRNQALKINRIDKVVVHTIAGITTIEDYKWLADNNFKVLILGYKDFRNGSIYKTSHKNEIEKNISELSENFNILKKCKSISFDTLGTEQLKIKEKISAKEWEKYYMGDDGKFTMYIDLVNNTFAPNSTYPIEKRIKVNNWENAEKTFKIVKTMN